MYDERGVMAEIHEIAPSLYLTSFEGANNEAKVKKLGITHMVSLLSTSNEPYRKYLRDNKINSLYIICDDAPNTKLYKVFAEAHNFINQAIKGGGKVMVHCMAGVSRSSTIVISYLMWRAYCKKEKHDVHTHLMHVRSRRPIVEPNVGFIEQLKVFEASLVKN
ncbi:hypothetical protein BNJ_00214 [Kaumoebavirus]|uniref:hypothetical protein n=1 Tax=Kaumoebavirus TaxID=1859492 RepID=UPI0009C22E34|nr:hypothetical protein BNJ_00214 [Kaumoebavirus]ARA72043.1 hypothetical protein BNJ_00214 [Kaumoebavirus]